MRNYDKSFLNGMEQNEDGTFQKKKTVPQPREFLYVNKNTTMRTTYEPVQGSVVINPFRTITLNLFGEPMAKQSVRSAINKESGRVFHFQPQKYADRMKDYHRQIKEQLPKDFIPFTKEVHITKMHFVFQPLKAFHKVKGRMDALRAGEVLYKTTKPDCDNLFKLTWDSLSEVVFTDDALICSMNDVKKIYGTGGCIIIEIKGK